MSASRSNPIPVSIPGERRSDPARILVELRKDQVPELDVAVALPEGAFAPAGIHLRAQIPVELARRPAGAGGPRWTPEVVSVAERHDAAGKEIGLPFPEPHRFFVGFMYGHPHPTRVELDDLAHELPCPGDGFRLEVIPEGEIAQHLEERVMPDRMPDLFDVGRPHAFLHRRGARGLGIGGAIERLELHHPGGGEEERGIAHRNQRGARDDPVPAHAKEIEEEPPQLGSTLVHTTPV
jgi:hypothetical protein